jgi:hypothetical protein
MNTMPNAVLAARNPDNDPRPLREEVCASCNLVGYKLDDGDWVYDVRVVREPDGPRLDGEDLFEADDSPMGWVCSDQCRSQAMYDKATPEQKEALDKVRDACMVLSEYGETAKEAVGLSLDTAISPRRFLLDIHDTANDPPDWCNRPLYVDRLARVAERASRRLRYNASELGVKAQIDLLFSEYPMHLAMADRIQDEARLAASCALLADDLKAAVEGCDA